MEGLGILYILFGLFVLVLVILWICLPFAVFGIKERLDSVLAEAKAMNLYLKDIRDSVYQDPGTKPAPGVFRAER